jgi:hypothetical protein
MANPNIVSVSSIYGESIGEALPADDVLVSLDKPIYLMEGDVLEGGANDHASTAVVVTVAIVKAGFTSDGIGSGEDNAATIYLASTLDLPADDVLVIVDKPIYLMEGDVLEGGANPATADIFISYEVIDDA